METVAILVPAALYASIYDRYREQSTATITACLFSLVGRASSEVPRIEREVSRYPRPRPGTTTGRVWEIADRILKETGSVSREAVIKACMDEGINVNTASTQFSYWRKANP